MTSFSLPGLSRHLRGTDALFGAAVGLSACATATVGDLPTQRLGSATLTLANGMPAGTAQLLGHGNTVTLAIIVTGLAPGPHGFHLHQTGRCAAPDFASAGGHLNPYDRHHGLDSPSGPHLGDMPNLDVSSSGTASTTVDLRGTQTELMDAIFDADGTAVVIHAGADDNVSDPAGNAGPRIACGTFSRTAAAAEPAS